MQLLLERRQTNIMMTPDTEKMSISCAGKDVCVKCSTIGQICKCSGPFSAEKCTHIASRVCRLQGFPGRSYLHYVCEFCSQRGLYALKHNGLSMGFRFAIRETLLEVPTLMQTINCIRSHPMFNSNDISVIEKISTEILGQLYNENLDVEAREDGVNYEKIMWLLQFAKQVYQNVSEKELKDVFMNRVMDEAWCGHCFHKRDEKDEKTGEYEA